MSRSLIALALLLAFAPTPSGGVFAAPASAATIASVVGDGSAASCTEAALRSAVSAAGSVSFACGASAVTIALASPLDITAPSTTIDGGGLIALSGRGSNRIITQRSLQTVSELTLRNLTLTRGNATGVGEAANGAAIRSQFQGSSPAFIPHLTLENVSLIDNDARLTSASSDEYDFGGALFIIGGELTVKSSTFRGNDSANAAGGAIHILRSSFSIADSTFDQNTAIGGGQGGAIYIDGLRETNPFASIARSSFRNSRTHNAGGAIYVNLYENSGGLTIDNSSFVGNQIIGGDGGLGGAIAGGGSSIGGDTGNPAITIRRSLFADNAVTRPASGDGAGGALAFAQRARISIENTTFSGNRAEGTGYNANGGALYVVNNTEPFSVVSSTFVGNYAGWVGGAISASNPGGSLKNTLLSGNSAGNGGNSWNIQQACSKELSDGGGNFQYPPRNDNPFTYNEVSCFVGKSGIDQRALPVFRDPQLRPLAANGGPVQTASLAPQSPARAAGGGCPATDARGVARPSTCDSGAYQSALGVIRVSPDRLARSGGEPLTVSVFGDGFTAGTQLTWNGSVRSASLVDATQLRLTVLPSELAGLSEVSVDVVGSALPPVNVPVLATLYTIYAPRVGS